MKKNLCMMTLFICGMTLMPPTVLAEQVVEAEIHGIACSFCAYGLEKKIKKMTGVETVSVNVTQGKVVITMRNSATLEKEPLEKVVKDAGFTLKAFSVQGA
ncbi:MAG: heavy metal-associated domain-containing protein [Candidatus Omnitrophota bacterium]